MHSVVPPLVVKAVFVLVNETVSGNVQRCIPFTLTSTRVASVGNRHSFQSCNSPEEPTEIQLYGNV